jgi:hypothetical protein
MVFLQFRDGGGLVVVPLYHNPCFPPFLPQFGRPATVGGICIWIVVDHSIAVAIAAGSGPGQTYSEPKALVEEAGAGKAEGRPRDGPAGGRPYPRREVSASREAGVCPPPINPQLKMNGRQTGR